MSAIITLNTRVESAKNFIESLGISGDYTAFFIGNIIPWDDEHSPDDPIMSMAGTAETLYRRIFMKVLNPSNGIIAIKRYDWVSGVTYTRADYNVDYTDPKNWISATSPFYVMNSEGNVYKCISNNYDSPSTIEPTGTYTTYIETADGYVWKFMFNLTTDITDKFFTNTWIPVPYLLADKSSDQVAVENAAISGDISYIHVDNGGDNYTIAPTIIIEGNGTGATGTAIMNGNSVERIQVTNAGTGYTWAIVKIEGNGTGASATAMVSPPSGHGNDASFELGAFYSLIEAQIAGDEGGTAPVTGEYRTVGLVKNTKDTSDTIITDASYNTLNSIHFTSSGDFVPGELVIGENSLSKGYVYYDPGGIDKNVDIIMISTPFVDGENVYGQESNVVGIYNDSGSTYTNVDLTSGELLYNENIQFINRGLNQIEKFIFTVEF